MGRRRRCDITHNMRVFYGCPRPDFSLTFRTKSKTFCGAFGSGEQQTALVGFCKCFGVGTDARCLLPQKERKPQGNFKMAYLSAKTAFFQLHLFRDATIYDFFPNLIQLKNKPLWYVYSCMVCTVPFSGALPQFARGPRPTPSTSVPLPTFVPRKHSNPVLSSSKLSLLKFEENYYTTLL